MPTVPAPTLTLNQLRRREPRAVKAARANVWEVLWPSGVKTMEKYPCDLDKDDVRSELAMDYRCSQDDILVRYSHSVTRRNRST